MIRSLSPLLPLVLALAACQPATFAPPPRKADLGKGMIVGTTPEASEQKEGECWAENKAQVVPAGVKTPEAKGKASTIRFRVPCPEVMTPEFIMSLQRALQVRGFYSGPVSGTMDAATEAGVRRYQKSLGLDLPVLTLSAAQSLGIAVTGLEDL